MFARRVIQNNARVVLSTSRCLNFVRNFSSFPPHTVVAMPALSPTMEVGTIGKWLVGPGDEISAGVAIAEVETDKATMAFEAQDEFFIAKLLVEAGSEVQVGQPIFVSVESKDLVGAFSNFAVEPAAAAPVAPTPAPTPAAPKAEPTPAPKQPTPAPTPAPTVAKPAAPTKPAAAAPPLPTVAPTTTSSSFYGARWGEAVKKSPLLGKLSTDQAKYIEKYGRCAQKPL